MIEIATMGKFRGPKKPGIPGVITEYKTREPEFPKIKVKEIDKEDKCINITILDIREY